MALATHYEGWCEEWEPTGDYTGYLGAVAEINRHLDRISDGLLRAERPMNGPSTKPFVDVFYAGNRLVNVRGMGQQIYAPALLEAIRLIQPWDCITPSTRDRKSALAKLVQQIEDGMTAARRRVRA